MRLALCLVFGVLVLPAPVLAQADKYNVTPEEHAACDADAYRVCSDSENQDQVLACMRDHRTELTARCRVVFERGLKRRHLRR